MGGDKSQSCEACGVILGLDPIQKCIGWAQWGGRKGGLAPAFLAPAPSGAAGAKVDMEIKLLVLLSLLVCFVPSAGWWGEGF